MCMICELTFALTYMRASAHAEIRVMQSYMCVCFCVRAHACAYVFVPKREKEKAFCAFVLDENVLFTFDGKRAPKYRQ